jgi:hypothetical protein
MLSTADQFVDRVATGSSMTGEAYKVRCGTRELTSKAWLHESELRKSALSLLKRSVNFSSTLVAAAKRSTGPVSNPSDATCVRSEAAAVTAGPSGS